MALNPPKRFRRAKITDVSRATGLSVSTVSRALNGYSDVSEETRSRVIQQAKRMGYTASSIGLKLRKGRALAAGFVIPPYGDEFVDPVFLSVLAGADPVLRKAGIQLVVTTAASEDDQVTAMRRMIEGDQVDSMILVRVRKDDARVAYLHDRGIPFSLLGRSESVPSAPSVEVDCGHGVEIAMTWLAGQGRTRCAQINAPERYTYGLDRSQGFWRSVDRLGLERGGQVDMVGDLTEQGGYQRALELLQRKQAPDAIICANDAMAVGALHAVVQCGLAPGRDVSVVGFGDVPIARLMNPPLTTLKVAFRDLGERLAGYLLEDLGGRNQGQLSYTEKPELVVRST